MHPATPAISAVCVCSLSHKFNLGHIILMVATSLRQSQRQWWLLSYDALLVMRRPHHDSRLHAPDWSLHHEQSNETRRMQSAKATHKEDVDHYVVQHMSVWTNGVCIIPRPRAVLHYVTLKLRGKHPAEPSLPALQSDPTNGLRIASLFIVHVMIANKITSPGALVRSPYGYRCCMYDLTGERSAC